MNDIDKVSDIQVEDVLEYLRIADAPNALRSEMKVHLGSAKSIVKLNGNFKNDEELDKARYAVAAVFSECARLYEEKNPEDSTGKESPVLKSIYKSRQPRWYVDPSEDKEGEWLENPAQD